VNLATAASSAPRPADILRYVARRGLDFAGYLAKERLFRSQWYLAYRFGAPDEHLDRLSEFVPILPPPDRFWADPFVVRQRDRVFVFFEELPFATLKGILSVLEITPTGIVGPPLPVLERSYHLSYPMVFSWGKDYFMVPETLGNKTIELYRARRFPYEWELESVLMDKVLAVDNTLVEMDGRLWMFSNMAECEHASHEEELHAFYASNPTGPWRAHRANPVKRDARSARGAGRIYRHGDAYYRPAQDGSRWAGESLSIQRVTRLTLDEYDEVEERRLSPSSFRGASKLHTFNFDGPAAVIDVARRPLRAALTLERWRARRGAIRSPVAYGQNDASH